MTVREAPLSPLPATSESASAVALPPAPARAWPRVEIDSFLALVEKPQRYIGGERNARHSPLAPGAVKWALCFPEVYEIGMSHLGLKILYAILNDQPDAMADRAYCPWTDMEAEMRKRGVPAFAHESRAPLRAFDVLGFSLQYELTYGNVLTMLDLAGIPLHAADRTDSDPIVLGGGPCMANPEPMADFFDAFLIGDGEEAVLAINSVVLAHRNQGRDHLLRALARIPGVYVPALYEVSYHADGKIAGFRPLDPTIPAQVKRVWIEDLSKAPFPTDSPVPLAEIVQDRMAIEVVRGCTQGCRFCQAGYWYRPIRERSADQVTALAVEGIARSGFDDVSLVSLSTADHSQADEMAHKVAAAMKPEQVSISLPSLRADSFSVGLAEAAGEVKKNGFTFAPETGSERLRRVINKNITDASLLEAVGTAYRRGWSLVKLYFMIGLPTETMADVDSIASLIERVNLVGRQSGGGKRVNASVGAHVPKAFTPFQWEGFENLASLETKLGSLRRRYQNHRFVRLKWHDLRPSFLEAVFSLGDRRVGRVIEAAWRRGARFDGWGECFNWGLWMAAFEEVELDPEFYTRPRELEEILPWDLLDADLTKKFLLRERRKAFEERLTNDCRWGDCHMCGIPNAPDDIQLAVDRPQALGVEGRTGLDGNLIRKAGFARKIPIAKASSSSATAAPATAASTTGRPELAEAESVAPEESTDDRERVRLRLVYRTGEEVRYVAHADLMRAFHRAFRVARAPVVMSQGFTPRPRAAFGPPLPLGVTGAREAMDVDFHPPVPLDLVAHLNAALPSGIAVDSASEAPGGPSLAAAVTAADYRVALPAGVDEAELTTRLAAFAAAAEFPVTKERHGRPDRTVDLKQAVLAADHRAGEVRFQLAMNAANGQQVSASVVLGSLLGWSPEEVAASRIERLQLHTADGPL
jgi:radical SAM family uncharacterized protein/radical SAM-linked protein